MLPAPSFPEANAVMQPPADAPEVMPLAVLRHSEGFVSAWRPTFVERVQLLFGANLYLHIMSNSLPPVGFTIGKKL